MSNKSRDNQVFLAESEDIKTREPIITKVLDKPQLVEVREVKNVSVVHKDIVQEIHEQPIIEIAKKHETVHIDEGSVVNKTTAPTRYEEIKNTDLDVVLPVAKETLRTEEIGNVKNVELTEEVRQVTNQELIERHIVPTVTEVREQKIINVIEQPVVRTITEKTIVRVFSLDEQMQPIVRKESTVESFQTAELRDSSLERERQIPAVQESTHVLRGTQVPHGSLSETEFTEEVSRGKTFLHSARPLSSELFKEEIKFGQENLHVGHPLSQEAFLLEVQKGKTFLHKSRYFSKDAFIGEFMASKALLKPVEGSLYSRELSELGNWKTEHFGKELLQQATGAFWNTYAALSHKVVDTYEHLKDKVMPEK